MQMLNYPMSSIVCRMKRLFKDFLDLVFPNTCSICKAPLVEQEEFFCLQCWNELPKERRKGAAPTQIELRLMGRIPLEMGASLFQYQRKSEVQSILQQIKYKGGKDLAFFLGKKLAMARKEEFKRLEGKFLVPVPLHSRKLQKRGFNQSLEIAKGISEQSGLKIKEPIKRIINTSSQTKMNKVERWENVNSAFLATKDLSMGNQGYILVDDVFTTGSTIEACAATLIKAGVRSLSVATLATATH